MAGIATSHIHCSCPLMVGEFFLGPAVSPSWHKSTSSFDGVRVGHGVLMRSPKEVQPTLMRSVAHGSDCFKRMKWNS